MDVLTAEAYDMPSTRAPAILQFNRLSGEFMNAIRTADNDITTLGGKEYFVFVVADISLTDDEVVGRYPDYKIVPKSELPTKVFEEDMKTQLQTKITREYPVIDQVNILSDALLKLGEHVGVDLPELLEMRDYIQEAKRAHNVRKKFFQESPDYDFISTEKAAERSEAQLDGGVHEFFGPRETTGGRVFS